MPTPGYPLFQRQSSKCHLCLTLPLCGLCATRQQREPDAELGLGPEINNLFPGTPGYTAGNNSSSGGRDRSPKRFSRNSSFLTSLQRETIKSDFLRTRTVDFVRTTLSDILHSSAFYSFTQFHSCHLFFITILRDVLKDVVTLVFVMSRRRTE